MAVGTKFGSLAVANTLGQFRTDHNALAEELSFLANTTGVNHATTRIMSIKKTANVAANVTVTGANTRFIGNDLLIEANTKFSGGTVSIGGATLTATIALANTNSSIATQTSRVTLVNTNLTGTNTALRTLINDRAQVANVAALAALGNTNARIALNATGLTGTNTALRLLIADRMQVANSAPSSNPVFTGSVGIGNSSPAANLHVQGTFIAAQGMPIRKSGGNNITLALTDNGKLIRCINTASAVNIHIPTYASVGMPLGSEISFVNECTHASANSLGFSNAAGVTLLSKEAANTVADRFTSATLKKVDTNTWLLIGNLS